MEIALAPSGWMLLAIAAALVVAGTVFLFRNKAAATGGCLIAAVVPAFLATQTARPAKKVDLKVLGSEFHIEFREESVKVEDIPGGVAAAKRSTSDIIKSVSPQLSPEDRDSLIKRALPEVNAVLKQFHIIALPQSLDNINAGDVLKIFDDGDIKLIVPAEAAFGHLNSRSVPSAFPSIATEYNPSDGSIKFSMTCNDATLTHVSLYSLSKSIKDNVVGLLADPKIVIAGTVFRCGDLIVDAGTGPHTFHNGILQFAKSLCSAKVPEITGRFSVQVVSVNMV